MTTFRKAVIPAAGRGTRLLPITKELPKEMLPIFTNANGGKICLKPMLQAVFEQLYDVGFRDFCLVVGRGKRAIEDITSLLTETSSAILRAKIRFGWPTNCRDSIREWRVPESCL